VRKIILVTHQEPGHQQTQATICVTIHNEQKLLKHVVKTLSLRKNYLVQQSRISSQQGISSDWVHILKT